MPRNGANVYTKASGSTAIPNTTIDSTKYNATIDDLVTDANLARPIVAGGTGAATAATARTNLDVPQINSTPLVVFAWGQSNIRGFADSTNGDKTTNPRVFYWNQNALGTPMVAGTVWNVAAFGTPPLNINSPTWSNSMSFAFAKRLQERSGRPVYVMQIAMGSHHIESFITAATRTANGWSVQAGDQDFAPFMYPGIATALAAIPGAPTKIDYCIASQGEANQEEQVEIYAAKLTAVYTDLAAAGLINLATTPLAHVDLLDSAGNPTRLRLHNALVRAQEDLPTLRTVSALGLPPTATDGVHWTGEGLVTMGGRIDAAFAGPIERADYATEPLRFGVDYGLRYFTPSGTSAESDIAKRTAMPLLSTVTIENNATLGWCYRVAANGGIIIASRRVFPVPDGGSANIAFEALTTTASATVDVRLFVYQYDKSKVFITSKIYIPPTSPLTDAMGRTIYRARFGRSTVEADMAFDAGCEFFAYGIWVGQGGDDESTAFNILDMSISNPISTLGTLGPRVDFTGLDLARKLTAPAVVTGAATLTNANLQATVISYTGAAAAVTFPLGATLDSLLGVVDTAFEFSVINTGSGTATMTANTGVTILGAAAVAVGTSARWAVRRTGASTYVAYRTA